MRLDRTAALILLMLPCLPGAVYCVRRELRRDYFPAHRSWREAPASFIETCLSGVLTGMALGLAFGTAVLILAAIYVHIGI